LRIVEKTLELNVMHELLSLGDTLLGLLTQGLDVSPIRARVFRTTLRARSLVDRPPHALGLSLRDEAEHGWDAAVKVGGIGPAWEPVAYLIQFKRGRRVVGPQPAFTFPVNNNKAQNQHSRLRRAPDSLLFIGRPLYAFPAITEVAELEQWAGRIGSRTRWFSVKAIDKAASDAGVDLGLGAHSVRLDDHLGDAIEIRSDPVTIDLADETPAVIAELVTLRAGRRLRALSDSDGGDELLDQLNWEAVMTEYGAHLLHWLGLGPQDVPDHPVPEEWHAPLGEERVRVVTRLTAELGPGKSPRADSDVERRRKIFERLITNLRRVPEWAQSDQPLAALLGHDAYGRPAVRLSALAHLQADIAPVGLGGPEFDQLSMHLL
jgi:hypothetical protein